MPRSLVLAACFALAFSLSARPVELPKPTEKWIALQADDFRFISAVSPGETRRIARELLRMRAALGKVSDFELHTTEPTRIFIFATESRFTPYCAAMLRVPCDQHTGLFIDGSSGNFILLPGDAETGVDRVVYHELTHHLMANTNAKLPLWFNEGLAEYFSTFRTVKTETHLGIVVDAHLRWLRDERLGSLRKRLIPLRELFATTTSSPVYNEGTRAGVFYAQSWALVHYLLHDEGRRTKLRHFLALLRGGKTVDEAFATAFAMPFADLEQALRTYIRGDSFTYYARTLGELAIPELPEPAAMPRDAVLHQLGHLLVSHPANAAVAERFFREALAVNGANAGAHAGLARLHDLAGRRAEADAAYAKAVELGSDDPEVYLLAGRSILRGEISEFVKARPFFQRATELDPKSPAAWTGLGATYLAATTNRAPGIAALQQSLKLDPYGEDAAFYLAQLWAADGKFGLARGLIDDLLARTTDATFKAQLTRVRESIDGREHAEVWNKAKEKADRSLALISQAVEKVNAGKYEEALALVEAALPGLPNEASRTKALALRDLLAGEVKKRR